MGVLKLARSSNSILSSKKSTLVLDTQTNFANNINRIEINMEEMGHKNLPEFYLDEDRRLDSVTREYIFNRESDTTTIFIR